MQSTALKTSRYLVVSDPVVQEDTQKHQRVIFGTRTACALIVSESVWRCLLSERFDSLPESMLVTLQRLQIIVRSDEDELQTVIGTAKTAIAATDTLYEVIQPSALCQLGCGYCGQQHRVARISRSIQDKILQRIRLRLSSRKFRNLKVCWFGAEPLTGLEQIRLLTPQLQVLALEFDCRFTAKIVTNGFLLSEELATELMSRHGVDDFEVTLDGTADFHDTRRLTKTGQPTFWRIFRNLQAAARCAPPGVAISVRCNVDRHNFEGVSPLLELIAREGIQQKISFYVAPIHSWGNDADKDTLSQEDFAAREVEWFAQMAQLGFKVPLFPKLKPIVCMAVNPNAELIDPYGSLFNCTEVPLVPTYGRTNEYSLGTLEERRESSSAARLADFNEGILLGTYDCSHCAMLPVCGGACPKQWGEGRVPCPAAKFNMKERLLLALAWDCISAPKDSGAVSC